MKLGKRSIAMVVIMLVAVGSVVTGTLAFLTDTSSVTNTFTVGKVDIDVDETKVNPEGKPVDENGNEITDPDTQATVREPEGNEYHLIPGASYTKDPTMTVKAGSEASYLRMRVTITDLEDLKAAYGSNEFKFEEFVQGWDPEVWVFDNEVYDTAANTLVMEFRYHEAVDASDADDDIELVPLFTGFTVPTFFDGDDLVKLTDGDTPATITVVGDAIQNTGFADDETSTAVDKAWAAFDSQMNQGE